MSDNLIQSVEPDFKLSEITESEKAVIIQLRRLDLKREHHLATTNRPLPVGLLTYADRRYLEIRDGFMPILVPSNLKSTAENLIRQYLVPYMRHLNRQAMATPMQSPVLSPLLSNMGMPASVSTPFAPPFAFLGSPALPPSYNTIGSRSSIALTEPASSSLTPGSPEQTIVSSPVMTRFTDMEIASNGTPDYTRFGLASPPYLPEPAETDELTQPLQDDNTEVSSVAQSSHALSKHPKLRTKEDSSVNLRKPSSSTESVGGKNSENDADDELLSDDGSNENGTTELRKPPNAFILYRKAINKGLRERQPNISVEAASTIIGKYWREESAEVKQEYKDKANAEREKYFFKKKQLQTQLKRKRIEREERVVVVQTRPATKRVQQVGPPVSHPVKQELICSESRELSSFTPEALAQGSQRPLATTFHDSLSQTVKHPAKFARSLTLGCERQLTTTLPLGSPGCIGSEAGLQPMSLSETCVPSIRTINQHVDSSLEQLKAAFSQPMQHSPMMSMPLEMSSETSAALQPCSNFNSTEDSTSESRARLTAEPTDLKGIIHSLFRKSN
ncbi:hypothetical protein COEREDRAFT_91036 [Coemansia reversa NRRL 1564]|uniref:HMG box domain-containing protein n=1 Tax=Coemansia reversa (strain ATCC 12441 / NRRL 1564) TaxID=763665 RepID=A0A2G5BHX8_COERN|nr:hypothetical protein COEREDRAFT_91036 [Coemansia reversa NRRL 1564]|eukprot:PIA18628.1 hypothetical protein COEREDRAFT_91036 [Coemansia reversa NRRL 1564]